MQQIRKDIHDALFVQPMIEHQKGKPNSLGDMEPGADVPYSCYFYLGEEKVLNSAGEEVISNMQIYVRGTEGLAIQMSSTIDCGPVKNQRIIAKNTFYGRKGAAVISVVYLP